MDIKPTPPPWFVEIGSGGFFAVTDKEGNVIASLDEDYEDAYADALLISAVHELKVYAECQAAYEGYSEASRVEGRDRRDKTLLEHGYDGVTEDPWSFVRRLRDRAFAKARGS